MVDSLDELKSSRSVKEFFLILRCWTRRLPLLWIRSCRTPTLRRSSSWSRKPQRGPVWVTEINRFHHQRRLSSDWCTWYKIDYCGLFSVTLHDDNVHEFGTRWDEVQLWMSRIPSDNVLESLYKLRIRESDQLKTVLWFFWHWDSEDMGS